MANNKKPKVSFRPCHGKPFKKFSIYRKRPNGTAKFMGNMIAPNIELARQKANENFKATINPGAILFVLPRVKKRKYS